MKVSKRFVLVLVQVLEEKTGTVLRVIFFLFPLAQKSVCTLLVLPHLQVLNDTV